MIKKFLQSEFTRNVTTLVSGTAIAHAITILFSIILVRFYSPEDFGLLALFISIFQITSTFVTFRFEHTIILPKKDEDAESIISLLILIIAASSIVYFLLFSVFHNVVTNLLNEPRLGPWLLIMPIYFFIWGIHQTVYYWFNRQKQYLNISISNVSQSGSGALIKSAIGLLNYSWGLIAGTMLGQLVATLFFVHKSRKTLSSLSFDKEKIKQVYTKYISLAASLSISYEIQRVYVQIPILFMTRYFDAAIVGYFFMAQRIVSIPVSLISRSIGNVFRQAATEEYHKKGRFDNIFKSTLKKTLLISVFPFAILFFIAPELFAFVFGEEWRIAGEYAKILVFAEFITFNITPVDKASLIREKKKYIFWWNLSRLVFNLLIVGIAIYFNFTIEQYLWGFVIVRVSHFIWDLLVCYRFSLGK